MHVRSLGFFGLGTQSLICKLHRRFDRAQSVPQFVEIITGMEILCVPSTELRCISTSGLEYQPECIDTCNPEHPLFLQCKHTWPKSSLKYPLFLHYESTWAQFRGSFKVDDLLSLTALNARKKLIESSHMYESFS